MTNICDLCSQEFTNKYNLKRHQKTSCRNKIAKPTEHECKYCNNYFSNKGNLGRHRAICPQKEEYGLRKKNRALKEKNNELKDENRKLEDKYKTRSSKWKKERCQFEETNEALKQEIIDKNGRIAVLKTKYESGKADGKIEVYEKVCTKVLDKSTVTNTYIHPKLVNLPITTIHPLTPDYVKDQVANGNYGFDNYLKGEDGLVEFIYSITMCENDEGEIERNFVCTDPSRDSYHRLVETKEWQKDKGGKFMDVILDTLGGQVDNYHNQLLDERIKYKGLKSPDGYNPDYVYKKNNDMHSGVVQTRGNNRKALRQRLKKETSQKISV